MTAQRHAIRRQVIELQVAEAAAARDLQRRATALVTEQVLPLLERCLDAASHPDRIDRIERLELDLGRVPAARLAEVLATRVAERLPAALRRALPERGATPPSPEAGPAGAALLLLGRFARSGA